MTGDKGSGIEFWGLILLLLMLLMEKYVLFQTQREKFGSLHGDPLSN